MYEKTEIFYFSGTGNSYQVAVDISSKLSHCKVTKITDYRNEPVLADRVGVVFPVYMWGLPVIVKKFFEQIQINKGKYIFAVATYGGLPGNALGQAEKILADRGLTLFAGYKVKMPGNYIMGYGAFPKSRQERIFKNEKKKSSLIAQNVGYMKRDKIEQSRFTIDSIFADKMYKNIENISQADKNFYTNANCTGCGKCTNNCPVSNIILTDGKPEWLHHCELCTACIQRCPFEAIQYGGKTKNRKHYINPIYNQHT